MEFKKISRNQLQHEIYRRSVIGVTFSFWTFVSQWARADQILGGLEKSNAWIKTAGIAVTTGAIVIAGLIMAFNKERGFEKISGAIIGCVFVAAAGAIVSLIQSFFG